MVAFRTAGCYHRIRQYHVDCEIATGDAMTDRTGKKGWFDADAFHAALDGARRAKAMNWKEVAAASGVSASTLTRMAQGKRPDVDGLAALVAWSGLNADDFVRSDDEPRP